MAVHAVEARDDDRHGGDDDPGPVDELRLDHHDQDEARGEGADRVDDRAAPPSLCLRSPAVSHPLPVSDHPGLRQREAREHADDVELDQSIEIGVERPDEKRREDRQDDDAVAEHQPVAAVLELPRQEPVASEDRGEPREVLI